MFLCSYIYVIIYSYYTILLFLYSKHHYWWQRCNDASDGRLHTFILAIKMAFTYVRNTLLANFLHLIMYYNIHGFFWCSDAIVYNPFQGWLYAGIDDGVYTKIFLMSCCVGHADLNYTESFDPSLYFLHFNWWKGKKIPKQLFINSNEIYLNYTRLSYPYSCGIHI